MQEGMTVSEVSLAISPLFLGWNNAPEVRVLKSEVELPERIRDKVKGLSAWGESCGIFDGLNKRVYLIADHISSSEMAGKILLQEVFGYYGLHGVLGDAVAVILKEVCTTMPGRVKEEAERSGWDLMTEEGRSEAAAQVISDIAISGKKATVTDKIFGEVRNWMRKVGFKVRVNESDFRLLASRSGQLVRSGGKLIGSSGSIFISRITQEEKRKDQDISLLLSKG